MPGVVASRRVACAVLGEVRRRDARAREVLRASERVRALDVRDRALVSRLALGVVGARGLLDQVIDGHLSTRAHLEPKVRDALRLSAYELLFMVTPAPVVVAQGVELVRTVRPRAAGLANAVLRRVVQEELPLREGALARVRSGEAGGHDLALVSGYPAWLLARVAEDRGKDVAQSLALSALDAAPVYVAANAALARDDVAYQWLDEAGLGPRGTDLPGSFVLDHAAGLAESGLVEAAKIVVADLAAQHVATMVGPQPGSHVLEIGQGRGTKSILLSNAALRAGGQAHIVGVDVEPFKADVARARMERAGLASWVGCYALDGRKLASQHVPKGLVGPFDVVFVDAPCSGTGTLRRHPEIAWRLTPEDVDDLRALQLELIVAAATRVRVGGSLCYATCSVLRAEDEDVVDAFLTTEQGSLFAREGDALCTIPAANGPDGHFCARLVRMR